MTNEERLESLFLLQEAYPEFTDFMTDVWEDLIGVPPTDIQYDIGRYMQYGDEVSKDDLHVEAQRGEAKTTIAGCFCVWSLIHDPTTRVLVVSSGGKLASQISGWVIKIIMMMEILECLRPSVSASQDGLRQKTAVDGFEIHHSLKGADKSPSVACLGVFSNMQGFRADLLIADDVESTKNSMTELMREQLRHLCKDFPSLCSNGRIIYLGTPQSTDTIYNMLPAQGFSVRIWPGRYPTPQQVENYGPYLAPIIRDRIAADPSIQTGGGPDGTSGQPTDPIMFSEVALTKKEIKQGPAYFQLQHMLNARLADQERYPLKMANLMTLNLDPKQGPGSLVWGPRPDLVVPLPAGLNMVADRLYRPATINPEYFPWGHIIMAVDPAGGGQNGDETGWAVLAYLNSYVFVLDVGGNPGGHEEEKMLQLARIAQQWGVRELVVEKNYGNGVYTMLLTSALRSLKYPCTVSDVMNTGQKELRIIDALEPVMGRHRLIFNESIIASDWKQCGRYASGQMTSYSLFWQLARITREKRALRHDDRLEAVAIGVRHIVENLCQNPDDALAAEDLRKMREFWRNPLSLPDYIMRNYNPDDMGAVEALTTPGRGAVHNIKGRRMKTTHGATVTLGCAKRRR